LIEVIIDALIVVKGLKAMKEALKKTMKNAQIAISREFFAFNYTLYL
jgi:hypothetical protein